MRGGVFSTSFVAVFLLSCGGDEAGTDGTGGATGGTAGFAGGAAGSSAGSAGTLGGAGAIDGGSAAGGTGGATGGAAGSAGAAGAAGSSALVDACAVLAKVACAKIETCMPTLVSLFKDPSCEADGIVGCIHESTLPGNNVTPAALLACAQTAQTATCDDYWYGGDSIVGSPVGIGCYPKGSLPAGAKCVAGGQCASLGCAVPPSGCGTCMPGPGDPCTFFCAGGAWCLSGTCVAVGQLDASCASTAECGYGLMCTGGKCVKAGGVGAACSGLQDCDMYQGAHCVGGTCAAIELHGSGESCGGVGVYCVSGTKCALNGSSGTCMPQPNKGDACSSAGPTCNSPYKCVSGVCALRDPATCP